jgi:hypothetical protein
MSQMHQINESRASERWYGRDYHYEWWALAVDREGISMRRITAVLAATAILMAMTLPASAAIHPIVCSGDAVANGLVDNPARGIDESSDIGNPPGLTPDDVFFGGFQHFDDLTAGDDNPTGANAFAPLVKTGFSGPQYDKPNCTNP